MKTALATLSAIALVATPIYVANAAQMKNTTATKSVAKQAKAEGESTKTEAKEIRQRARTHSTKAKATKSVAAQAKAEGESVKTEAKEIRHHAAMKKHHTTKHHKTKRHVASKSKTKAKTGTSTKKSG